MKKTIQQLISLLLTAIFIFSPCPFSVSAADISVPPDGQTIGQETTNNEEPPDGQASEIDGNLSDGQVTNAPSQEETPVPEQDSKDTFHEEPTPEESLPEEQASQNTPETNTVSSGTDTENPFPGENTDKASSQEKTGSEEDADALSAKLVKKSRGQLTEVKAVSQGIQLTWKPIEGAAGYILERKIYGDTWKTLNQVWDMKSVTYTDSNVSFENIYYYRVKAFSKNGIAVGKVSASKKILYIPSTVLNVETVSNGIQLHWNRTSRTKGYRVYRKLTTKKTWTKIFTIKEPGEIAWRDTSVKNGTLYSYAVTAYNGDYESAYSNERTSMKLSRPSVKGLKRKSSTRLTLTWKTNPYASGYQIQYAKNSLFSSAKKITIRNAKTSSYTLSKLSKNRNYYVRIRAFKKEGGKNYFSVWSPSGNIKSTRTTKVKILKRNNKVFELRSAAKQKLYQYDVLQGSCTDGTYSYYLLLNKNVTLCKVVKVRHSTMKVAAVSDAMYVGHGNDMTYNSDKKCLVVAQSTGNVPKALISIDAKTLKIIENKRITIPTKLAGASYAGTKAISGFNGIAYSSKRKQYVTLLRGSHNFVILDSEMNPIQYVKASKKNYYLTQGIDATDDYILVAQSPYTANQVYNIITVYDWDGNYISKINVKRGYEIESIFHIGSKYYAGFYRSYYKTCYRTVVKKVKVKGKLKKKKVKESYSKFMRDNYVYQISGI